MFTPIPSHGVRLLLIELEFGICGERIGDPNHIGKELLKSIAVHIDLQMKGLLVFYSEDGCDQLGESPGVANCSYTYDLMGV
jgi:hypothetical protein